MGNFISCYALKDKEDVKLGNFISCYALKDKEDVKMGNFISCYALKDKEDVKLDKTRYNKTFKIQNKIVKTKKQKKLTTFV